MITARARYSLLPSTDRDLLGEGPWWSALDQTLMWVDIWGRRARQCRLDGSGYQEWAMPSDIGFAVPGADGGVIVGLADGIHWLDVASGRLAETSLGPAIPAGHRLNDGKGDRSGRLWFGTIREDGMAASAALYRYDGSSVDAVLGGIRTSNGLGWSPAGDRMYYTDSPTRRITAYDFDAESGALSAPREFAEDPASYTPDGLTVDAEGFVWSAKWDGGLVVRYSPDGVAVLALELPVRRPTSCMFVGPGLDVLAVTSARSDADDEEGRGLAGSVFLIEVGVRGLAERPLSFGPGAEFRARPGEG